jgi:Domain of unknown function (DUF4276)
MVSELRIYFEGDSRLRPGFRQFLSEIAASARSRKWNFDLIATEGTPVQDFRDALKSHADAWNVLLLDWEDPDGAEIRKKQLGNCDPDSVFWMVQVMEAWFLADVEALRALYKRRFNESAVGWNTKVEEIPKVDVLEKLKKISGGEYHKVQHGTKPLELIDPAKVRKAAPNCERLFRLILARLG